MHWYIKVFKNYAVFNGRARRSEYWYAALFNLIIIFILTIVGSLMGIRIIGSLYNLASCIPFIAVGVRRMHDIDKSGWFILIPIYSIVLLCREGTKGDNQYGPDPKSLGGDVNSAS